MKENHMKKSKKTKLNLITLIIGAILLLIGISCLLVKGISIEYIDAQGILQENFFLVPIGFVLIFSGLVLICLVVIKSIIEKIKTKKRR